MLSDRMRLLLDTEIAFEKRVAANRGLSTFRRNPTTWELLLMLASMREGYTEGLHEVPSAITTRYLGPSALLKFIREQRDAGLIRFLEHEKRSKRILQADPQIVAALLELLEWRDRVTGDRSSGDGEADADRPRPGIKGEHNHGRSLPDAARQSGF